MGWFVVLGGVLAAAVGRLAVRARHRRIARSLSDPAAVAKAADLRQAGADGSAAVQPGRMIYGKWP